jgi:hypothetical protein
MQKRTFNDVAPEIARVAGQAGLRVDDAELIRLVNLAQENLITGGEWAFCYARLKFCQYEGLVSLPQEYEAIVKADVDRRPVKIMDQWYEFLDYGPGQQDKNAWVAAAIDRGESPVFRQPGATPMAVRVAASVDETLEDDSLPGVIVFGYDENNVWVRTELDGAWIDGESIEVGSTSATKFKQITQVVKPVTKGAVALAYVDEFQQEHPAARYRHTDTSPSYRTYFFPSIGTDKTAQIHAMVRRRFAPVVVGTDPLIITSLPALRLGVIGVAKEDAGLISESLQCFAAARAKLAEEQKLYLGTPKPPVEVQPVATFNADTEVI